MPATPLYLTGPYSPFVLACGFLHVAAGQGLLAFGPEPGAVPTLAYRFLLVEHASARLGERGPVITEGGIVLLPPGRRHRLRLAQRTRLQHLLFDLVPSPRAWKEDGSMVSRATGPQPEPSVVWGVEPPTVVPAFLLPRLRERWSRIRARYWRSLPDRLEASALLALTLAELVGAASRTPAEPALALMDDEEPLRRAVAHGLTAVAMDAAIGCAELAHVAGLSPAHFRRRFTALEGLGPRAWLIAKRLDRAAELLAKGGSTAAEVAARTRWASPAAFTRAFARRFGCTPARWRQLRTSDASGGAAPAPPDARSS